MALTELLQQAAAGDDFEGSVDAERVRASRLACRLRRLRRALFDLGLLDTVGPGWCRVGEAGFEFSHLSDRKADQLVIALESLAERLPDPRIPEPGSGQTRMFEG